MWQDQRLLAAIAALPAEAFIDVPPEGGHQVGRQAARRSRHDGGAEPDAGPGPDRIELHLPPAAD
jgi:hypothetical protein